jgi:hypothetical protein
MDQNAVLNALAQMRLTLLDLTGRNRLLNFKHPIGKSLQFVEGQPAAIFQRLVETDGRSPIAILGLPEPLRKDWIERNGRFLQPEAREWARERNVPLVTTFRDQVLIRTVTI